MRARARILLILQILQLKIGHAHGLGHGHERGKGWCFILNIFVTDDGRKFVDPDGELAVRGYVMGFMQFGEKLHKRKWDPVLAGVLG